MRTLTITAAEWASVQDGTLWLVREGWPEGYESVVSPVPPVEFVQACAPCENEDITCHCGCEGPCPDCRIELVGLCPRCDGRGEVKFDNWGDQCPRCSSHGTVILGYAYPVGSPLPIIRGWSRSDGDSSGDVLSVWKGHYGPDVVMQRAWNATAIQTQYADRTAALAHYGPPESLVGKWAIELRVVGS